MEPIIALCNLPSIRRVKSWRIKVSETRRLSVAPYERGILLFNSQHTKLSLARSDFINRDWC
jgi:hypothetical protein